MNLQGIEGAMEMSRASPTHELLVVPALYRSKIFM